MTLIEYVQKSLNGEIVPSVEMGGISVDYENAIQHLAFLMMVQFVAIGDYDESKIELVENECVKLLDAQYGFSGAQVAAATNLSCIFWKKGVGVALDEMRAVNPERIINLKKCRVYVHPVS